MTVCKYAVYEKQIPTSVKSSLLIEDGVCKIRCRKQNYHLSNNEACKLSLFLECSIIQPQCLTALCPRSSVKYHFVSKYTKKISLSPSLSLSLSPPLAFCLSVCLSSLSLLSLPLSVCLSVCLSLCETENLFDY